MASSGSMLFLSREDLLALGAGDMNTIVPQVQAAFDAWNNNDVIQPPKVTLKYSDSHERYGGLVNVLPAALRDSRGAIFGLKALGAMPSNVGNGIPRATGLITLFDGETKTPIVCMDAQVISAMRTGAVTALAAKKLCPAGITRVGLIGAGVNMRTQLLGLVHAAPSIAQVKVYSRGDSKNDFVRTMAARFPDIDFAATTTAQQAVADAEVVVTCVANADTPVVSAADLSQPGLTVFNIGCLENEPILLKSMDLIVADYWEHSKHRGVQTHAVAYQKGYITDTDVVDLKDIISGAAAGRTTDSQRIFFCPTGLGVEDIAVARELFRLAVERDVGNKLELWSGQPWI